MNLYVKIALRNVVQNKRRSLLIGVAIFFSCFILLFSGAVFNGVERQIYKSYKTFQSGDIVIIWENLKDVDKSNYLRLFQSKFDYKKDDLNEKSIDLVNLYINRHKSDFKHSFFSIKRFATIVSDDYKERVNVFSMTKENMDYVFENKSLDILEGAFDATIPYGVMINEGMSKKRSINLGDWITMECVTSYGANNSLDFKVVAIYKNGAEWDNINMYMPQQNATEFFDFKKGFYDIGRLYVNDESKIDRIAEDLNGYLEKNNATLMAEPYEKANTFIVNIASMLKSIFTYFVFFLMFIIAIGINASVKMNLFERIREFGTLRAIGYSRMQNYFVIFFEILSISLFSLSFSALITGFLVLLFSRTGVYVGSGVISAVFGGERFYPEIHPGDSAVSMITIIVLSLMATLMPSMNICRQKISDLLMERQKKIRLFKKSE
jgi:putative ABC transport system permease protein